jgi:hypothetical protein
MPPAAILLPVFVQVGLTLFLGFRLALARRGAVMRGDVRVSDIALGRKPWPDRVQQLGNSFESQFEVPTLFYALVAFAMITGTAALAFVVLAWAFVASRFAHAFVHTTSNHLRTRFRFFALGGAILLVMWVIFAVRILVGAA